jgi:hypothetical protein
MIMDDDSKTFCLEILEVEVVRRAYGAPDRGSISKNGWNGYFIEG